MEIEIFTKKKEKWLRKFLRLENGIPTDDTIRIVISSIKALNTLNVYSSDWRFCVEQEFIEEKTIMKNDGSAPIKEEWCFLCSIEDIDDFSRAVGEHWGVENGLHWHLDFTFKDDKNTTMHDNGAKGLQIFKKIGLAILKVAQVAYPQRMSLKSIRYRLSLDFDTEVERIFPLLSVDNLKNVLNME